MSRPESRPAASVVFTAAPPRRRQRLCRPRWLIGGGLVALAAAWLGPLPELAAQAMLAHMSMHVLVVAVAAPLLAVGLAQTRFDPAARWPRWFAPIPASVIELVVIWAWHAPLLHHLARHSGGGLVLEQGMFLASGLLVWLAAFGGDPQRRSERAGAGIAGLLMTSMHMTLLGALLALSPRLLYAHGGDGPWGLSALGDQQAGGLLMLLGGGVSYLAGGLILLAGLLQQRRHERI